MSPTGCPDIETLFSALEEGNEDILTHLEACPACAALVEDHRQLEKDLLRLADPLPPPDFVHKVMAKVEKAPVPLRREVWSGLGILVAAVAAVVAIMVTDAAAAGAFGTGVASALLHLQTFLAAIGHALSTVWDTAALPATAVASFMIMFLLLALRRFTGQPQEARVTR